jgi:hypothetical protein
MYSCEILSNTKQLTTIRVHNISEGLIICAISCFDPLQLLQLMQNVTYYEYNIMWAGIA